MPAPSSLKEIRVLVLDPLPASAKEVFQRKNYKVDEMFEQMSEGELIRLLSDYQVVCVREKRSEVLLTDEVIKSSHKLQAIGVFSQCVSLKGARLTVQRYVNQIDLATAQIQGIPVFSSPYGHSTSVAELSISFIILLARQLGDRSVEVNAGEWNKVSSNCYEIRGKTLGILGYGHVGSQLGIMAESLGMRVVFYDVQTVLPIGRNEPCASVEEVLKQSDFVSINVSQLPENDQLIGEAELAMMKKKSYLINAGYPHAVDLEALAKKLQSGHLLGAALDVFPEMPAGNNVEFKHPFTGLKNVILTPNIGDATAQASERTGSEVANSIAWFLSEGSSVGAVNFPSIKAWPLKPGFRRIINIHRNIRGVLKEIDNILSGYNVGKQVLDTNNQIGYLLADVSTDEVTSEIVSEMAMLSNTIRTRIL